MCRSRDAAMCRSREGMCRSREGMQPCQGIIKSHRILRSSFYTMHCCRKLRCNLSVFADTCTVKCYAKRVYLQYK